MSIVIVGGGKMGLSHLAIAAHYVGKENVVLCDRQRLMLFAYSRLGFRCERNLDAVLRAPTPPAGVIVATPTGSHFPIARQVLEAGVPCFVEKPLTLNAKRSGELVALAEAKGVAAQMGFVLRYVATYQRLRRIVESGDLGRVTNYRATMLGNVITKPSNDSNWRTDFARGGGVLNEYGPHLFDLCRYIFGNVSEVMTAEKGHSHSVRGDDRMAVEWAHDDRFAGSVMLDWCDTTKRKSVNEFSVEFERGRIRTDNSALHVEITDPAAVGAAAQARLAEPILPSRVGYYLRGEEFSLQLEDFIARCTGLDLRCQERPDDIAATLRDGLEVDRLIDRVAQMSGLK